MANYAIADALFDKLLKKSSFKSYIQVLFNFRNTDFAGSAERSPPYWIDIKRFLNFALSEAVQIPTSLEGCADVHSCSYVPGFNGTYR